MENKQLKQLLEMIDGILKEAIEDIDNGNFPNGLEYARDIIKSAKEKL